MCLISSLVVLTLTTLTFTTAVCPASRGCFPPVGNIAFGRTAGANSTCGDPARVFEIVTSTDNVIDICNASRAAKSHQASFVNDNDTATWWQAEEYTFFVTLQFNFSFPMRLEKSTLTFRSFRPNRMILEKSSDYGLTWTTYQYYSPICLGMLIPDGLFQRLNESSRKSLPSNSTEAFCVVEDSTPNNPDQFGTVEFQAAERFGDNRFDDEMVINHLVVTNLRARFRDLSTLGDDFMPTPLPDIKRKYFYAVTEWVVEGHCYCSGHAERCIQQGDESTAVGKILSGCDCQHNTQGNHCDECLPMYNNKTYQKGNSAHPNEFCECHQHSQSCVYDEGKGFGVCQNCTDNTEGDMCERCKTNFYVDPKKNFDDPGSCIECNCSVNGSLSMECDSGGACLCKTNVEGTKCDVCKPGFFNLQVGNPHGCQANVTRPTELPSPPSPCLSVETAYHDYVQNCTSSIQLGNLPLPYMGHSLSEWPFLIANTSRYRKVEWFSNGTIPHLIRSVVSLTVLSVNGTTLFHSDLGMMIQDSTQLISVPINLTVKQGDLIIFINISVVRAQSENQLEMVRAQANGTSTANTFYLVGVKPVANSACADSYVSYRKADSLTQQGIYCPTAKSDSDLADAAIKSLSTQYAPRLKTEPSSYIIREAAVARNFHLNTYAHCDVMRSPKDVGLEILWYKLHGEQLVKVNSSITNFSSEDNGQYKCRVQNYFGSVLSQPVHVELYDRPHFSLKNYTASVLENASVGYSILKVEANSTNYLPVVYLIESSDEFDLFPFKLDGSSGVLSVSRTIDSGGKGSPDMFANEYQLIIGAALNGLFTEEKETCSTNIKSKVDCAVVTIKVVDVNEFTPTFQHTTYSANVSSLAVPYSPLFNTVVFSGDSLQASDGDKTSVVRFHLLNHTSLFSINSSSGAITAISSLNAYSGQTLNLTVQASNPDGKASTTTVSVYIYDQCLEAARHLKLVLESGACNFAETNFGGTERRLASNTSQWWFGFQRSTYYFNVLKVSLSGTNIDHLTGENNTGWVDVYYQDRSERERMDRSELMDTRYTGRFILEQTESSQDFVYWNINTPLFVPSTTAAVLLNITISVAGQPVMLQSDVSVRGDDVTQVYLQGNSVLVDCHALTRSCILTLTSFKQQDELARLLSHPCIYDVTIFKPHLVSHVYRLANDCITVDINVPVPTPAVVTKPCFLPSLPYVSATSVVPFPGSPVTLSCKLQDVDSQQTNIVWLFEGMEDMVLTWQRRGDVQLTANSVLQIHNMSAERQGHYSCCASCNSSDMTTDIKCSSSLLIKVQGLRTFLVTLVINQMYNTDLDSVESSYAVSLRDNIFRMIENSVVLGPYDTLRLKSFRMGSVVAEVFLDSFNMSLSEELVKSQIESGSMSSLLDITEINVKKIYICTGETTVDSKGTIKWPDTAIGQFAIVACPHGSFGNSSNTAVAFRYCNGSYVVGSTWNYPNTTNCEFVSVVTRDLRQLAEISKEQSNITEVIERTTFLTSNSSLTEDDLVFAADIVENVVANEEQVTPLVFGLVIQTISNLLVSPTDVVKSSQLIANASTRIVRSIEDAAFHVRLAKDTAASLTITSPHVAVAVYKTTEAFEGYTFASRLLNEEGIISPDDDLENSQIVAVPKSMVLDNDDNVEASIVIPPLAFPNGLNNRLQFFLYQNAKFFQPISISDSERTYAEKQLNSRVVAARLGNFSTSLLSAPASLSFLHFNRTYSNATCVFWDFAIGGGFGGWRSSGCRLVSEGNGFSRCECDHLTNFAVLVDPYQGHGISEDNKVALSVISYIGCSLSLVGLILTAMTYGFFRRFRKERPGKILINLCISMSLGLLFFVVYAENHGNSDMCTASAVLLHYFWLSSFFWMIVEGVNMYLSLVKVIGTYVHHFMLKATAFAWGVPLIIVAATMAADFDSYKKTEDDKICLLKTPAFYYAFYVVIGLLLVANFTVFGLVMRELGRRTAGVSSLNKSKSKQQLKVGVSISLLLGLTWIFAATGTDTGIGNTLRLVFQYLFAVTVSVQGLLIFLVYCAFREEARNEWVRLLCKGHSEAKKPATSHLSGPNLTNKTSTTSVGGTNSMTGAGTATELSVVKDLVA